jgi:serine/threonine protein kinase
LREDYPAQRICIEVMRCPSCQDVLADDAQFCGSCGMPTARHSSEAATQIDLLQETNTVQRSTDDQHARPHDPRVGLILDSKYKLLENLGQGGMGSVFRAQRLHIGDEVAVKLLHHDLVREKQALERFRREARAAAMIRHPNVVSIHDFNDGTGDANEAYIVMELVQGVSLGDLLRRDGRMSPRRAVHLMHDICAGVGVAHRQGLLHRDLKPDNVIVVPPSHEGDEETAKVVDFGLAKVRDAGVSTALTHTGVVMGTLYYMSPEQCSGEELDARADVYSLGAMLYEMLAGGPPFRSNNFPGLIAKHLHEPPPPLPKSLEVPPALEAVCLRALAKDRNQRQPDAIAFGRDLQTALTAPVVYQPSSAPAPSRHSLRWVLVASGVFLALVVILGLAIAIPFGMERLKASRDVASNQTINQNSSTPVESPEVVSTSSEDLRGTWMGTYGPLGYATKLIIKNQNGDKLDGTLEQGAIRVAFDGTYDSKSRTLKMKQTKVLSGEGWSLGEDAGKLSDNGRKISGTGKDPMGGALGMSYEWSFTRK